jgi:hypothetical protein
MRVVGVAGGVVGSLCVTLFVAGCGAQRADNPHWRDKATVSERAASDRVGGFTDDERRLYHLGVQHIVHGREHVGTYTVRQVVDQEQTRENMRHAIRKSIADDKAAREQRARQQREHERHALANRNELTPKKVCNNLHTLLADTGSVVGGMICRQIKSDLWSIHYTIRDAAWTAFTYDQRLQLAKGLWAGCIKAAHMSSKPDSCNITLDGEAGERLGGSSWLAGSMIDVNKD